MNLLNDLKGRGTPISGVGIQMHIDTGNYPSNAELASNIQQIAALGLQVHFTEADVRIPVDSVGNVSAAALQAQAATYQRILTICLQSPGCTAFQTWGFTDKYSWIPGKFSGLGCGAAFRLELPAEALGRRASQHNANGGADPTGRQHRECG